MKHKYIYTSLTRISDLEENGFQVKELNKSQWQSGDYVVCTILNAGGIDSKIELRNGRMRGVMEGELLVGALGERFATLDATGTWKKVDKNMELTALTAAGLLGKLTSKSFYSGNLITVKYLGHTFRDEIKLTMDSFVKPIKKTPFNTPVILLMGTSMSAGKTTAARVIAKLLLEANYSVVGAKITGAGRYKDILAVKDVGVETIIDFVDAGLPSSICPRKVFKAKMEHMMNFMSAAKKDVAVVEIGASPIEPYNGDLAISMIRDYIKCVVLCASDPYAVYGIIKAFNLQPDFVTGIATNTIAGRNLVENLCDVRALNILDPTNTDELKSKLSEKLSLGL